MKQIINLVKEIANVGDTTDLDNEDADALNVTLAGLGLEPIEKNYTMLVTVLFTQEVEIEVPGYSVDDVTQKIENGDFEEEIKSEFDRSNSEIYEYSRIEEN